MTRRSAENAHRTTISRRHLLIATGSAAGLTPFLTAAARPDALIPADRRPDSQGGGTKGFHAIGSLGGPGTTSEATDINDRGDVVGVTSLPGTATMHAFIMNPDVKGGRPIDITPSQSRSSRAAAVNGSGTVVGTLGLGIAAGSAPSARAARNLTSLVAPLGRSLDESQPLEPFVWRARTGLDILPLPPGAAGAQAVDVNDKGLVLVVGTNATGVGLPVGSFLWNPARREYTPLPPPAPSAKGPVTLAHSLDERGGVAGGLVTEVAEQTWQHTAVVWEPGTLKVRELSAGGGSDSYAIKRNKKGLIVGWRMSAPGQQPSAVYWPKAGAAPIALPGRVPFDVNAQGQIVGIRDFPESTGFPFTAVVWEPDRDRTNDLGDNGLGSYVAAVNSSGRTAGYAIAAGKDAPFPTAGWWSAPRR